MTLTPLLLLASIAAVSFGRDDKSGTIDVTLHPGSNQKGATEPEKIVGNWSC